MAKNNEGNFDLADLFYLDDSEIGEYASEEEEFEDLYTTGMQPSEFGDKAIGAKYKNWMEANRERLIDEFGDLNSYFQTE